MAVFIVGKTREEAEQKAAEYEKLARAEGFLAHAGGGGIDLAAYPPETPIEQALAIERAKGRDHSHRTRFYRPGNTIGDALHEVPRSDRKSTRLNSSHVASSYAVFCLNK